MLKKHCLYASSLVLAGVLFSPAATCGMFAIQHENPDEALRAAHLPTDFWSKDAVSYVLPTMSDKWTVEGYKTPIATPGGNCISEGTVWSIDHIRGSETATVTGKDDVRIAYFNPGKAKLTCASVDRKQYVDVAGLDAQADVDAIAPLIPGVGLAVECVKTAKLTDCGSWRHITLPRMATPEYQEEEKQRFISLPSLKMERVERFKSGKFSGEIEISYSPQQDSSEYLIVLIKTSPDGSRELETGYGVID